MKEVIPLETLVEIWPEYFKAALKGELEDDEHDDQERDTSRGDKTELGASPLLQLLERRKNPVRPA